MRRSTRALARAATAVAALIAVGAPAAGAGAAPPEPVEVLASGLEAPFGLQAGRNHLYVAESGAGPRTGRIVEIQPSSGRTDVVARRLTNPSGVDRVSGVLTFVTGGEEPTPDDPGDASLFVARRHQRPRLLADLEAYELANNPDGQLQFDPETGEPLDALSNPFAVIEKRGRGFVLVADAGANAVLMVTKKGKVSTFFVPPVITTGACEGRPNNDPEHAGCDPVPTGLAYGPDNTLYVSTLSGESPGQGRVYVLDARTGEPLSVIKKLTSPTGVAVRRDGTVYVSEVLHGAPPDPENPPPGFDPADVGRIVSIAPDGRRSEAGVTMPIGLVVHKGSLYSTAWSLAGFLGMQDAGQVVKVRRTAFS